MFAFLRKPLAALAAFLPIPLASLILSGCQPEQSPFPGKTADTEIIPIDPVTELSKAHRGDPVAQFNVGQLYFTGKDVPQDYHEARFWFEKAANQGLPAAQSRLAIFYQDGLGTPKNPALARKYFEAAAEAGDTEAQINLAKFLLRQEINAANMEQARYWLDKAAEKNSEEAEAIRACFSGNGKSIIIDRARLRAWLSTPSTQTGAPDTAKPPATIQFFSGHQK